MRVSYAMNVKIMNMRTAKRMSADAVLRDVFDEVARLREELTKKELEIVRLSEMLELWKETHADELEWLV